MIEWWYKWDPKGKADVPPPGVDPSTEVKIQMRDGEYAYGYMPAEQWRWDEDDDCPESDIVRFATRQPIKKCN